MTFEHWSYSYLKKSTWISQLNFSFRLITALEKLGFFITIEVGSDLIDDAMPISMPSIIL